MFTCSKCQRVLEDDQQAGRYRPCRDCMREYKAGYRAANREQVNAGVTAWKRKHADEIRVQRSAQRNVVANPDWRANENAKQKIRRAAKPEHTAEQARQSKARNKPKNNETRREWVKDNLRVLAWNAARRSRQSIGIAQFFQKELEAIYEQCPSGHHVDHIHPLNGENFSGLHVPWNLQYLPAAENIRKRNKLMEAA